MSKNKDKWSSNPKNENTKDKEVKMKDNKDDNIAIEDDANTENQTVKDVNSLYSMFGNNNNSSWKSYVDGKFKTIQDIINSHINNISDAHTGANMNSYTIVDDDDDDKNNSTSFFPSFSHGSYDNNSSSSNSSSSSGIFDDIINKCLEAVSGKDISQDSNHRLLTDAQINEFSSKVSYIDLDDCMAEIKKYTSKQIDSIINSSQAMETVRMFTEFLNQDTIAGDITKLISSKISREEFEEFKESLHITNEDRKALDKLNELSKTGMVDWNASEDDSVNYIKNKPKSLPANGGNASTVGGYNKEKLMCNKSDCTLVVGVENFGSYTKDNVNILLPYTSDFENIFNKFDYGKLLLREGKYDFKRENDSSGYVLSGSGDYEFSYKAISGINHSTCTGYGKMTLISGILMENMTIRDTTIVLKKNVRLQGISFINCIIDMSDSNRCVVKDCEFDNTSYIKFGNTYNSMVMNNFFYRDYKPVFVGGNNVITNNISY